MNLPKARTGDIIEQEAGGELLIYDLRNDQAYTLNETSKIVYRACSNQAAEKLKRKYKFTDDLIHFALGELAAHDLIENYQGDHFAGLSRRDVIRKVGMATLAALPVIAAISAPSAANAASLTACERTNCQDGNAQCNFNPRCAALDPNFVCCSLFGNCACNRIDTCLNNGGEICPAII